MTNEQLRSKYEKKGYKITSCIGWRANGLEMIEYQLKDQFGRIIKTAKSLSALLR